MVSSAWAAVRLVAGLYRRHALAFWPDAHTYLIGHVLTPLLFVLAFGWGVGSFIEVMGGLDYRLYVVAGLLAYKCMFAVSMESALVCYSRCYYLRIYDYLLTTPVRLGHIVAAEVLWAMTKASLTCAVVLAAACGGLGLALTWSTLLAVTTVVLAAGFTFAAVGLVFVAFARSFEFFAYMFALWIYPSLLFSGVFYDLEQLPSAAQWLAWAHPLTHLIAVIRPWLGEQYLPPSLVLGHLGYVALFGVAALAVAVAKLRQRLYH